MIPHTHGEAATTELGPPRFAVTRFGKFSQYPAERSGTCALLRRLSTSSFILSTSKTIDHGVSFAGIVNSEMRRPSETKTCRLRTWRAVQFEFGNVSITPFVLSRPPLNHS